jgi:hypothetical protein
MKMKKIMTISLIILAIIFLTWIIIRVTTPIEPKPPVFIQNCREVEIMAEYLEDTSGGAGTSYDLTLKRIDAGREIGGVKIVVFNNITNSVVGEWNIGSESFDPLETLTGSLDLSDYPVPNANKVDITAYFIDELGNTELCPYTITKEF